MQEIGTKKSIRVDTTRWARWSTGNCARNWNLTNKWYMHNPEYVLENETHKIRWDFEIQKDHLILARRPVLVSDSKKTCWIVDFAVPADHKIKIKENEERDEYLYLVRKLKSCGTWRWSWYQMQLAHFDRSPKEWWRDWKIWN